MSAFAPVADLAGNARMRPQDWKSGDRLWVVEVIAPFGKGEEMVDDLKAQVFPARALNALSMGLTGQRVRTL
jgi:cytolysin-activating lysine-acyltransferase